MRFFFEPTALADVPADARILREEVLGPVAAIVGFDGEDAGIAAANDMASRLTSTPRVWPTQSKKPSVRS